MIVFSAIGVLSLHTAKYVCVIWGFRGICLDIISQQHYFL